MNVPLMRRLDRWVGIPLCFLLTLLRRIGDAWSRFVGKTAARPWEDGGRPPVILLVKLAEMGSTVLALPAIRRLQELYPGARFHYLCFKKNRSVLDLLPDLPVEAHLLDSSSIVTLVNDALRVILRLWQLRPDITIDLEFFARASAAFVYLSGAPVRVGYHRFRAEGLYCGNLYTHRVSFNGQVHTSVAFLMLAEATVAPPDETPMLKRKVEQPTDLPPFEPADAERDSVLAKLAERGYPAAAGRFKPDSPAENRPAILLLNVNASDIMPLRRWPVEYFVGLATRVLHERADVWIVLTGAPDETLAVESVCNRINHVRAVSLAGQTTIRELLTLFMLSDVLITNDSGPAHFAALTQIDILSLFGPETPRLYHPLSERNRSLSVGLACSPCINVFNQRDTACDENLCMQQLTVERVYREFLRVLEARRGVVSPPVETS